MGYIQRPMLGELIAEGNKWVLACAGSWAVGLLIMGIGMSVGTSPRPAGSPGLIPLVIISVIAAAVIVFLMGGAIVWLARQSKDVPSPA